MLIIIGPVVQWLCADYYWVHGSKASWWPLGTIVDKFNRTSEDVFPSVLIIIGHVVQWLRALTSADYYWVSCSVVCGLTKGHRAPLLTSSTERLRMFLIILLSNHLYC
jgi:hypothetical protein